MKKDRTEENRKKAIQRARKLRANATKHEKIVIAELVKRNIHFEFQKPFWSAYTCYIGDFYFSNLNGKKYVVEIDGPSHKKTKKYDADRSVFLYNVKGCTVKRFTNEEVAKDVASVVDKICTFQPVERKVIFLPEGKKKRKANRKRVKKEKERLLTEEIEKGKLQRIKDFREKSRAKRIEIERGLYYLDKNIDRQIALDD